MLRITIGLIKQELDAREIPNEVISESVSLIRFKNSQGEWHFIKSSLSDKIPATAAAITRDKMAADAVARVCGLPVLPTTSSVDPAEIQAFIAQHKPVVVKPRDASHGNGISIGLNTYEQVQKAIEYASQFSKSFLIQKQAIGDDYRVLIIDNAMVAAVRRDVATVTGDGVSTYQQLIQKENSGLHRGKLVDMPLKFINEQAAQNFLGDEYDTVVPPANAEVKVMGVANVGAGGRSVDVTDSVHPGMVADALKMAEYLHMPVCGLDFIHNPANDSYFFIEINSTPNLGLHLYPSAGKPRPVTKMYVDWLLQ